MTTVTLALALQMPDTRLAHFSPVDFVILALYFALVIFIGFYVKGSTNTSEEFFLAGREMSSWIAGLSFVSANLGSLELMGWAGAALPVRHSRHALVLDRRYSRHALPRHRHDALLRTSPRRTPSPDTCNCASAKRPAVSPPSPSPS